MAKPRPKPGARGSSEAGAKFANDAQVSSNSHDPLQAIPESEAEALAFVYGRLPADHLTTIRALWWRMRCLGVLLPVGPSIVVIRGGHHER